MKITEHPRGVEIRFTDGLATIGSPSISDMIVWAKDNCPSYITNTGYHVHNTREIVYIFFISEKKDLVHFLLKWAQ